MLKEVLHRGREFAAFIRDSSRCLKGNSNLQWMITPFRNGFAHTVSLCKGPRRPKWDELPFSPCPPRGHNATGGGRRSPASSFRPLLGLCSAPGANPPHPYSFFAIAWRAPPIPPNDTRPP